MKAAALPSAGARRRANLAKARAAARGNIAKAQAAIRERGLPTTEARRTASLANLAKANAVLRERAYPRNEKQIAAARANLLKAWEVSHARDPISYARCHAHRLKHGLFARRLDEMLLEYAEGRWKARTKPRRG